VSNFLLISKTFSPAKPPPVPRPFFEIMVLSARQAPVKHARGRTPDIFDLCTTFARDEDHGAGADRRGLAIAGQLTGVLDDEEHFFPAEWRWSGGPSPSSCHPMVTEMALPVASVVSNIFMSRPKGLIGSAYSGLTMVACSGADLVSMFVSSLWAVTCVMLPGRLRSPGSTLRNTMGRG
jgi:hypothetical protein